MCDAFHDDNAPAVAEVPSDGPAPSDGETPSAPTAPDTPAARAFDRFGSRSDDAGDREALRSAFANVLQQLDDVLASWQTRKP